MRRPRRRWTASQVGREVQTCMWHLGGTTIHDGAPVQSGRRGHSRPPLHVRRPRRLAALELCGEPPAGRRALGVRSCHAGAEGRRHGGGRHGQAVRLRRQRGQAASAPGRPLRPAAERLGGRGSHVDRAALRSSGWQPRRRGQLLAVRLRWVRRWTVLELCRAVQRPDRILGTDAANAMAAGRCCRSHCFGVDSEKDLLTRVPPR
mmetsp:Transcript_52803/g.153606  ORF Transcript_52803/g.153606 Transcript_52803/m.153606 type:complete len:205 (-) Transcript_52803:8-622(-)